MRYGLLLMLTLLLLGKGLYAQQTDPWTADHLYDPQLLADKINQQQMNTILILCVGPDALINGSVDIGPTQDPDHLIQLKNFLKEVPKDKEVIIYCGCCPFARCPNIRPAFQVLKEMGFKHPRLLNLPKNIKTDWLDKGYPLID